MTTGWRLGYRSHSASILALASAENSFDIGMLSRAEVSGRKIRSGGAPVNRSGRLDDRAIVMASKRDNSFAIVEDAPNAAELTRFEKIAVEIARQTNNHKLPKALQTAWLRG